MKTVEIHYIEFETFELANENKNFPHSGLFVTKTPDFSDLRFVDKSIKHNMCIVPESVLNSVIGVSEKVNKAETLELITEEKPKYDGDFILEFSRILLNRR